MLETVVIMQPADVHWNHDVARRGETSHRIIRNEQFSLCGQVVRGEKLVYVGTWDSGEPCTCRPCNDVWNSRRNTYFRNGGV